MESHLIRRWIAIFLCLFALLLWLICMHWWAVSLYELLDTLRFLLTLRDVV